MKIIIVMVICQTYACQAKTDTHTPSTETVPSSISANGYNSTATPTTDADEATILPSLETPTPTATPTPMNTLSPTEEVEWVLERMNDNGDCQLPCIWGISPGITTLGVHLDLLSPVSRFIEDDNYILRFVPGNGIAVILAPVISASPSANPNFTEREQGQDRTMVTGLAFSPTFVSTGSSIDDRLYLDALENYSLSQIFTKLGPPNRVLLQPQIGNVYWVASDLYYSLALLYEDIGVLVFYTSPTIYPLSDGTLQHCFPFPQESNVTIITQSLEEGLAFPGRYVERLNDYVEERIFLDVEDATGVTVEEFYEIYSNPANSNFCLTSPYNVWHSE